MGMTLSRLKELRETAGMSQHDLAKAIDVHPNLVSGWERGKGMNAVALARLCELFSVTPSHLLGLDVGQDQDNQA